MGFTTRRRVSIPPPLNGATWEERPPGPDSWAGSAVRHIIAPVTMAATGARAAGGREGKAMGAQRMHAPTI